MTNKSIYTLYVVALAVAFVGAWALGSNVRALTHLAAVSAIVLMMLFMTRGVHNGHDDG